jgi:hypothetical protein
MHHDAMHLVPQFFVRDWVLTDDDGAQALGHECRDQFGQRTGNADRTFVCLDPDEELFDPEMIAVDLAAALSRCGCGIPGRCRSAEPGALPTTGHQSAWFRTDAERERR